MQNVLLVIHILACLAMIGLVLIQKSEGGGLGIGGGANSLMTGRGVAGAVVRTTMIVGGVFFATSLALTALANRQAGDRSSIIDRLSPDREPEGEAPGLFDPSAPLPIDTAPAPAAPDPVLPGTAADPAAAPSELIDPSVTGVPSEVTSDTATPAENPQQ